MAASTIQISGLNKGKLAALRKEAKARGVSTEAYARELIEDALTLQQRAPTQTFDEILRPVREQFAASGMTEAELDRIVDRARTRHRNRSSRKASRVRPQRRAI